MKGLTCSKYASKVSEEKTHHILLVYSMIVTDAYFVPDLL